MLLACIFAVAYFLGAIPFGVLITRAKGVDVTKIGSGNIGATNVARAIGNEWAAGVFLLDVLKGFGPTFYARSVDNREWVWFLVGIAAIAGHCASPFLRFRGGKGIATSLGMVFGAAPLVAAGGFLVFGILFAITRFVSLSSIVAVGSSVILAVVLRDWVYAAVGSLLFLFVLFTHRKNIRRLLDGTEPKFCFKRTQPPGDGGNAIVSAEPASPSLHEDEDGAGDGDADYGPVDDPKETPSAARDLPRTGAH